MVPIVLQQLEREGVRHGIDLPGLRDGLEGSQPNLVVHRQVVRAAVGIARAGVHVYVAGNRV